MKSRLDEGTVKKIYATLLERFGEPIGDATNIGPGVADERDEDLSDDVHCSLCDSPMTPVARGNWRCPNCDGFSTHEHDIGDHSRCGEELRRFCGKTNESSAHVCSFCGKLPSHLTEDVACDQCGMMDELDQGLSPKDLEASKGMDPKDPRVMKDAAGNIIGTWKGKMDPNEKRRPAPQPVKKIKEDDSLDQKAPPGREKQVKALKKQKGVKNPFAVAWSSWGDSHK